DSSYTREIDINGERITFNFRWTQVCLGF
ncbi:hypothetical protein EDD56_1131, partial [Pseudobacteriovorax antillogorgiicola]